MPWPDTSSNSGVMGGAGDINRFNKRNKGRNKKRGKGRSGGSGGNNAAGRALFQRTLSRGSGRS